MRTIEEAAADLCAGFGALAMRTAGLRADAAFAQGNLAEQDFWLKVFRLLRPTMKAARRAHRPCNRQSRRRSVLSARQHLALPALQAS